MAVRVLYHCLGVSSYQENKISQFVWVIRTGVVCKVNIEITVVHGMYLCFVFSAESRQHAGTETTTPTTT